MWPFIQMKYEKHKHKQENREKRCWEIIFSGPEARFHFYPCDKPLEAKQEQVDDV